MSSSRFWASRRSRRLRIESLEPRMMLAGDGLLGEYFNDDPNNSHLVNLAGTRVDTTVNFPNDALGPDGAGMVTADDNYSIRWTGWVLADQAGQWQFKTLSNDGVRLWVDDVQLINNWDSHVVETDTANSNLSTGWHPIRLEYFQQAGTAHIELRFSGPGQSEVIIPQAKLSSTNPVAGGIPVANAGPDVTINLPGDENEAILSGSGTDGDGTIVAYAWTQLSGPNTATLAGTNTTTLTASDLVVGSYVFQLKVTDNVGNMATDEATVSVALMGDGLLGEYFDDGPNNEHLVNLAGTRVDATINFPNDALGADGAGMVMADDNYSIRWTGWVYVGQSGDWQFKTLSNDGVRLWVDDVQLIDSWDQHVVQTDTGNRNLSVGWHPIRLEYFQQAATAHIELRFSGPGQAEVIIPQSNLSSADTANGAVPVANAGPDVVIVLPDDPTVAVLNGSGNDSNGTIDSYAWTQISGPSTATLSGEATPSLTASNLVLGAYVFQLKVTDNDGNMDTDVVAVNVVQVSGDGVISGELKKWHKVTITFDGPQTSESATPNPFLDYRLDVTFTNTATSKSYVVPGYYAADGNAANSHATSGNKWRVHFAPSEEGQWTYVASFRFGTNVAVDDNPLPGVSGSYFDNAAGVFTIAPTDKTGRDHRGKGQLQYVGEHYLRFAETGEHFLKQGADSPENLLAYTEFDGPFKTDGQGDQNIKDWSAHVQDWQPGDPTWGTDYGKGIIGAVNYLASEGQNAFSFLTMNIQGDDKNVFPYLTYAERVRMDVSRLDQWEILFEHGDHQGMYLHFKTQETENDQLLDGGALGTERKLYYRELIARYSHHLALNWNLGEENTNTTAQRIEFAEFFHDLDPYDHNIVLHTFPGQHNSVYTPLLGDASQLTGLSIQIGNFTDAHTVTQTWVANSAGAGKKWVVAIDEEGGANQGVRPDNDAGNSHEDGRKDALWGTLMAGGAGDEWYFGYNYAHSDLTLTDFRSRDQWWDYTRFALEFFQDNDIPYWQMAGNDAISSATDDYGFIKPGELYVVYLRNGGTTNLNLAGQTGMFEVAWFDPRNGGALAEGSVKYVTGGGNVALGTAPNTPTGDWVILVRRPDLPGDYDHSGEVDPNDYLVWRADFGSTIKLNADGNNNDVVDAADYVVWRANLGNLLPAAAAAIAKSTDAALVVDVAMEDAFVDGGPLHVSVEVPVFRPMTLPTLARTVAGKRPTAAQHNQLSLLLCGNDTIQTKSGISEQRITGALEHGKQTGLERNALKPRWAAVDVAVSTLHLLDHFE